MQSVFRARLARATAIKGVLRAGGKKVVKGAGWAARKVGGAVDRQAGKLEERGFTRTARTIKLLAGSDTLLNTSFEIGLGAGMATPFSRVFNVGAGAALWSGSVKYHERGIKDVMFSKSAGVDSPFFGGGYSTLGKWGGGLYPIPFVSGFKDQRSYGVSIGNSGLVDLVFGEVGSSVNKQGQRVPARGPFMDFHVALPILPFVSYLSVYIGVTSPLLRPLTKPLERPAAWLDDRGRVLSESITKSGMKKLIKAHPELKSAGSAGHLLSALTEQKKLPGKISMRKLRRSATRLAQVEQALKQDIEVPLGTLLLARKNMSKVKNYIEGGRPIRDAVSGLLKGRKSVKTLMQGEGQRAQVEPAAFAVSASVAPEGRLVKVRRGQLQKLESRLMAIRRGLRSGKQVPLAAHFYALRGIAKLSRLAEKNGLAAESAELVQLKREVELGIRQHHSGRSATVQQLKKMLSGSKYQELTGSVDDLLAMVNGEIQRQRQASTEFPDFPEPQATAAAATAGP